MNARGVMSRSAKGGGGKGKLQKDMPLKPGFTSSEKVKEWPARTGYTLESRTGASSHGTKIKLP